MGGIYDPYRSGDGSQRKQPDRVIFPVFAVFTEDKGDNITLNRVKVFLCGRGKGDRQKHGKPMWTVDIPALAGTDRTTEEKVASVIAAEIRMLAGDDAIKNGVLVAGLGNRMVTADSLGTHSMRYAFLSQGISSSMLRGKSTRESIP